MQRTRRELATPDEVRRLPDHVVIAIERGHAPARLRRLDYRASREYAGLFDGNPMHRQMQGQ